MTGPVAEVLDRLPDWVTRVRADNPGPMTLEGTNSWILRAPGGRAILVDPGPDDPAHLAALAAAGPELILVTHGHPDHVDGLASLRGRLGGVAVWAAGEGRRSVDGLDVELLATPGHTGDSVCFAVEL